MSNGIDHYSFQLCCDICESKLEHVNGGRWGTKEVKAVGKCTGCGHSWEISVTMRSLTSPKEAEKMKKVRENESARQNLLLEGAASAAHLSGD